MTRRLDDALRAGKRQAAPFRKGPPKPDPKPPGRKSGDAASRLKAEAINKQNGTDPGYVRAVVCRLRTVSAGYFSVAPEF